MASGGPPCLLSSAPFQSSPGKWRLSTTSFVRRHWVDLPQRRGACGRERQKRVDAANSLAVGGENSALVVTLLHGGFARRVLTSRRLRSCYSSEYRTPELVHPVEGLDGNCNFSRTTGIVA